MKDKEYVKSLKGFQMHANIMCHNGMATGQFSAMMNLITDAEIHDFAAWLCAIAKEERETK